MSSLGQVSSWCILVLAGFGIIVNIASVVILVVKGRNQMFHHLLKIMAIYDLIVVVGCGLLYSLPKIAFFSGYSMAVFPVLLPWLLPIVQIAMMSSVYCTIVMSFERYIRICRLCQLKQCSYITKKNFKFYIAAIVILPIMFYIPKFFEVRSHSVMWPHNERINCKNFVLVQLQLSEIDNGNNAIVNKSGLIVETSDSSLKDFENITNYHQDCPKFNYSLDGNDDFYRNITSKIQRWRVMPTELRRNQMYYRVYCIGLNTFFASLLPITSLMFLNVSTVLTLRKMALQQEAVQSAISNGRSTGGRRRTFGFLRGAVNFSTISGSFREQKSPASNPSCQQNFISSDHRGSVVLRRHSLGESSLRSSQLHRSHSVQNTGNFEDDLERQQQSQQLLHRPLIILTKSESAHFSQTYLNCEPVHNGNGNEIFSFANESQIHSDDADETENSKVTFLRGFISRLGSGRFPRRASYSIARHSDSVSHQLPLTRSNSNQELRSRENRLTRISLSIVWLFMFCHVWKLIPTIYEGVHEMGWDTSGGKKAASAAWPDWLTAINDLSHTLIVFNSAVNFLIYITL